jgi:hypothetical protein
MRPSKPSKPFLKWLLDLSFDSVFGWKSLALETFLFLIFQTRKGAVYGGWRVQTWLGEQDVSFYRQGLENLIVY